MDIQSDKQPWRRTRVDWETKKKIWERWALGDTQNDTANFFELHADEFPKGPFHRHTIGRVRKELLELPHGWLDKLIDELPEIYAFVREKRPDSIEYIGRTQEPVETQSDHDSKLSIELSIIASNLEKIYNVPSPALGDPFGNTLYTVGEKVFGGWWVEDDKAKLGDVDRGLAGELLENLKEEGEFTELVDIGDWSDLNYNLITENFIQRLISRAHRGNF